MMKGIEEMRIYREIGEKRTEDVRGYRGSVRGS